MRASLVFVACFAAAGAVESEMMSMPTMLKASLPVQELERILTAAQDTVLCRLRMGDAECGEHSRVHMAATSLISTGTSTFAKFIDSLDESTQKGLEDMISKLRFDVFRPAIENLKFVVRKHVPELVQETERSLNSCRGDTTGSHNHFSCEVSSFIQLMKDGLQTDNPTMAADDDEDQIQAEGVIAHALIELKNIKKDVMALREKGASQRIERTIIQKVMQLGQREVEKTTKNFTIPFDPNAMIEESSAVEQAPTAPQSPSGPESAGFFPGGAWTDKTKKNNLGPGGELLDTDQTTTKQALEYNTYFRGYVKKHGRVPSLRDPTATGVDGHRMPPPSENLDWITVVNHHAPCTECSPPQSVANNYMYSKVMNIDIINKTNWQGRWHKWSVVGGLPLYYEDITQYNDKAICVDGSRARMYYSPAVPAKYDHFHIYLQGGYFAFDASSANTRCHAYKEHCSTHYWWEKVIKMSGLFNAHRVPKMAGWHHSVGGYCSSDAWMGRSQLMNFDAFMGKKKGAVSYFRGNEVFKALIVANVKKGMGMRPNQLLVMSGSSAGGIGLTNTIDHLQGYIKAAGGQNHVVIIGIMDAAVLVIGGPTTNPEWGGPPRNHFEEQTKRAWYNLGITYLYPPQLKKTLPLTGIAKSYAYAPWRMLLGEFRIPLVVNAGLHLTTIDDDFALAVTLYGAGAPVYSPMQEIYFHDYRERMYRTLEKVDLMTDRDGGYRNCVWAFRCYWHCVIENDSMFTIRISATGVEDPQAQNMNLNDVVTAFLAKKAIYAADRCQFFDCSCMQTVPLPPSSLFYGVPTFNTNSDFQKYWQTGITRSEAYGAWMQKTFGIKAGGGGHGGGAPAAAAPAAAGADATTADEDHVDGSGSKVDSFGNNVGDGSLVPSLAS